MTLQQQQNRVPGVSVVIPVYNRERYLAECIQSVLDQETDFPFEIICPDDGSIDKSKDVALSFGDSVRWIDKPASCQEQGAGPTRNRGMVVAQYPYIAFLDSDDIFLPGHLSRLFHFLETHPQFAGAIDQQMGFHNGSKKLWFWKYEDTDVVKLESYFLNPYFGPPVVMIRTSIIGETGYLFESIFPLAEDMDFFCRILEKHSFAILPEPGAAIRQSDHRSTSGAGKAKQYWDRLLALEYAIKRYPYPHHLVCKQRATISFRLAEADMRKKKYFFALYRLFYAAYLDPYRALKTVLRMK